MGKPRKKRPPIERAAPGPEMRALSDIVQVVVKMTREEKLSFEVVRAARGHPQGELFRLFMDAYITGKKTKGLGLEVLCRKDGKKQ